MTDPDRLIKVVQGMILVVRTASNEWIPARATSSVEGPYRNGRKIHDFPVVWVDVAGADAPLPWPLEDVRVPVDADGGGTMSDPSVTLATIDAALDGCCACGCGRPLDPTGPAGWFAGETCQRRWARRRVARAAPDLRLLHEHLAEVMRAVGEAVEQAWAVLAPVCEVAVRTARQVADTLGVKAPPVDPRERALWHVHHRNTGPRPYLRAPKRIDPPRSWIGSRVAVRHSRRGT